MNTRSPKTYADRPAVEATTGLNRRQVLTAAAVAAPAIALTTAVPAHATSAHSTLTVDVAASITSGDYSDVTVTVLDSQGNPWAGQSVTLTATGTTNVTLDATTGVTNSSGVFTTRLNTTINTPVGDTAVVTATSGPLTVSDTAAIVPLVLTVAPAPTAVHNDTVHVRAGEGNTLTATLTHASGRPAAGEDVSFDISGFDATFGSYDPQSPSWVTSVTLSTDANGTCTVTLTPETTLFGETATLTATSQTGPAPRRATVAPTLTATNTNVYGAGSNISAVLGDGTTVNQGSPLATLRVFPSRVTQVASGGYGSLGIFATLFLLEDGTVWSVGNGSYGMLGHGNGTSLTTPKRIAALEDVEQIAVGNQSSYARTSDGALYAWGVNTYNELGNGKPGYTTYSPGLVTNLSSGVAEIAVGDRVAFARTDTGLVKAWGNGYPSTPIDIDVSGVTGSITRIAASSRTGYVIAGGRVYSWGRGNEGQRGNGTWTSNSTPALVSSLTGVTDIATAYDTCYALTDSGAVKSWGSDVGWRSGAAVAGLLGNDSPTGTTRNIPGDVTGLSSGVDAITGIQCTAYALMDDGTLRAWGSNADGQFGNGTMTVGSTSPVLAGTQFPADLEIQSFIQSSPRSLSFFFIAN